jgi:hypothetical protein
LVLAFVYFSKQIERHAGGSRAAVRSAAGSAFYDLVIEQLKAVRLGWPYRVIPRGVCLSQDWGACASLLADLRQRTGGEFSGQPAGGYCQHAGCHVRVGAEIADGELKGRDRHAARPEHRHGHLEGSGM